MLPRIIRRPLRGAALLDATRPGWDTRINLTRLNIASPWNCVLGQEYGHYQDGTRQLSLDDWADTRDHGFNSGYGRTGQLQMILLTGIWMLIIISRRIRGGDIGKEIEKREYEPFPAEVPVEEPAVEPAEPEKVPA